MRTDIDSVQRVAAALLCAVLLWMPSPAVATDTIAPHVPREVDTDVCAMCHRTHGPASGVRYRSLTDSSVTGNALIVGVFSGPEDIELCYVCHSVGALGSTSDVESAFVATSAHSLAPTASPYGPSAKSCGSCHDSHGGAKTPSGTPYPRLLRAYTVTDTLVYSGDEYCAACHLDRDEDIWDGLTTWRQTPHSTDITPPANGIGIVCSACHESHGSTFAPLVRSELVSPAVPATVTVANDRRLCIACHSVASYTYSGATSYSVSSHAQSTATVTALGEWVSRYPTGSVVTTRLAGECANCHAPMGRKDASGTVIPKLQSAVGRGVCDRCHDADGPSASDVATNAFPSAEAAAPELVAAWRPTRGRSPAISRLAVWSRDTTGAAPRSLVGPREYATIGRTGDAASGDIDGDGDIDVVVGDDSAKRLNVFTYDHLRGISRFTGPGVMSIGTTPDLVAVADFLVDGSGLPEIAVVTSSTASMYVYRYSGAALTTVSGPHYTGNGASGIASGDVTGTTAADVVVTAATDARLRIYTQSGSTLTTYGPYVTRSGPRGPSTGDAWQGGTKSEIVVANAGEVAGTITVFDGSGVQLGSYDATGFPGAYAWDTAVGDVLPGVTPAGTSGAEVLVALFSTTGSTGLNVFPQLAGGGLGARTTYASDNLSGAGSVATGDVDGDGRTDAVIGSAGRRPPSVGAAGVSPSVVVYVPDSPGTALAPKTTLYAGGAEFAGEPPPLVIADIGGVGPSRHAVGAASGAHVSTETGTAARHVECSDCHDPHTATSTVAAAPLVYGVLRGEAGASVTNVSTSSITYAQRPRVVYEYEVCFKCHSGYTTLGGSRDIAAEVNTRNPGVHAVEAVANPLPSAQAGTYVTGWGNSSVLHCVDCHGNSRSVEASGPHASTNAPLLELSYGGSLVSSTSQLCYRCHQYGVYYTGALDGAAGSYFYNSQTPPYDTAAYDLMHSRHTSVHGIGCQGCHVAHGSTTMPHLLRGDIGWYAPGGANIGACTSPCHVATPITREYKGS